MNPTDTQWYDSLGIGAGGKPYVKPIEPISMEDDPDFVKLEWEQEEAYMHQNGIDPVLDREEESYSLVMNA